MTTSRAAQQQQRRRRLSTSWETYSESPLVVATSPPKMVSPIHKMNSVSQQQQQQNPSSSLKRSRRNLFASDSTAGIVTPPLDSPTHPPESSPQKSTASAKQLFPRKRPLRNKQHSQPQQSPASDLPMASPVSVSRRSVHNLSTKASTTALDSLANLLSPVSTSKLPISTPPSSIPADLLSVLTPQPSSPSTWKRLPHSIEDVFEQHRARRQLEFPPRRSLRRSCKDSVPSYIEVEEDEGLQLQPRQLPSQEKEKPPDLPRVIPAQPTALTTTNQSVSEPSSISLSRSSVPPPPSSVSSVNRNQSRRPKKKPLARNMRHIRSSVASSVDTSSFAKQPVVVPNQRAPRSQKVDVLADATSKPPSPRKSPPTKSPPVVTQPTVTAPVRSIVKTKHTPEVERSKSYKKIRFAPLPTTTTTFSVKIRVQTSANNGSSSSSLPSMDQSTVQSIATQIAQACMTTNQPSLTNNANQALTTGVTPSPAGNTPGASPMAPPDDTAWSESSDSESEGDQEAETARKEMPPPAAIANETPGYRRHRSRGRHDVFVEQDARSVASEITMDLDLTRGAMGMLAHTAPSNKIRGSTRKRRSPCVSSLPPPPLGLSPPVATAPTDSLAAPPETQAVVSPVGKKRRRLTGNDSLAGCSLASLPMEPVPAAKLPTQVEFAIRSPSRSRSREEQSQGLENLVEEPKLSGRRRPTEVEAETNIDETVVTDRSVDTRRSSASEGRCGKCSGCRRVLDCLTCRKCVASLRRGVATGRRTGCLQRQCRARRFTGTESLGRPAEGGSLMQRAQAVNDDDEDDVEEYEFGEASEAASVTSSVSKRQAHRIKQWHRRWNKEERKETGSLPPIGVAAPPLTRGRRKKKNVKNPLHYLELPMPTDGSVASYLEGKRYLRALMHYDEADQDWV